MSNDPATEAQGWKPEPGESITGKLIELQQGWSDYQNGYYPILVIRTEEGDRNVHCFHAVLRNRLRDIRPKIGDRLTITYVGQRDSKDGRRKVSIYKVESPDRKQDAEAFWDRVEGSSEGASAASAPAPDVPLNVDENGDEIPF